MRISRLDLIVLVSSLPILVQCFFTQGISAQLPSIVINEFLASNVTTNPDMVDFGDFSDWIELYNTQDFAADISGYYITDDLNLPAKWRIPQNTVIAAEDFYFLWADGEDDIPGQNYLRSWWPRNIPFTTQWSHTNFKLNKDAELIALFNPDGILIDSVRFTNQIEDVSYGRKPDGSSNWFRFGEPTPGKMNSTAGIQSTMFAGDVIFSQTGGFFTTNQSVMLSSSSGSGIIRYTLDGKKPTSESALYKAPISITENTILKARVFDDGKIPGRVFGVSYLINENRNLPAFSIISDPEYIMGRDLGIYLNTLKEREIPVNIEYFPLGTEEGFSQQVGMRIGGENIYRFAQKPLNIYARGDYGESTIEYQVFDHLPFQSYKRLYLRNSGDDWPYTMMRDGMISSLIRDQVSNSVQAYRPTVLYLNGNYWGIYNLREKLDAKYFSLHYNTAEADLDHLESTYTVIEGDSSDFITLLNLASSSDISDPDVFSEIAGQIDIQNLMDFVIVQAYLANSSWGHNREIWRDRGNESVWRWVLVDMDRGFDANRIGSNQIQDIFNEFELFRYLISNEQFKNEFIQRYSERINTTFTPDRVISIIDSLASEIEAELPRHISKWGNFIDSLSITEWGMSSGIPSIERWNTEVQKFRTFAEQRPTSAIQNLSDLFSLSGRSRLSISSNLNDAGKLDVNGFFKDVDASSGRYFNGIPISIKAYAPPGYTFSSWKQVGGSLSEILISKKSVWKYYDQTNVPNLWKALDFDDSSWKSGAGILGYGDDQDTQIEYGTDVRDKNISAYFRQIFELTKPLDIVALDLELLIDDGAVVYINGMEVTRTNMPNGTVSENTQALIAIGSTAETSYQQFRIPPDHLLLGENIIAIEVHQSSPTSSDLSFDLSLSKIMSNISADTTLISNSDSISITLSGDTELYVEFNPINSSFIPPVIDQFLTLTKANSPYFLSENVEIMPGAVLEIDAGVELLMDQGKGITIKGTMTTKGTEDEPVIMRAYFPGQYWKGLFFDQADSRSILDHLIISEASGIVNDENFFSAVSLLNSDVEISNTIIKDTPLPISSQYSRLKVTSSKLTNVTHVGDYINVNGGKLWLINNIFDGNNIDDMDAIDIGFMEDTTIIQGNTFYDFIGDNTDAIDIGDSSMGVQIIGNKVVNCGDKAVSIGQGSEAHIFKNVFAKCNLGVGIKDTGSMAFIDHNTFYLNNVGVAVYQKVINRGGGSADIRNSIFMNSNEVPVSSDEFSSADVYYSISDTDTLKGSSNLFGDIHLINPENENYYPQVISPVINASEDIYLDSEQAESLSEIGAFQFQGILDHVLVINEINYHSSLDFDPEDWIEFYNITESPLDISKWVFIDGSYEQAYVFKENLIVPSKEYHVLSRDLSLFTDLFPTVSQVSGNMYKGFSGSGESLYLYNNDGFLVDSLTYSDSSPWPEQADGNGPSLELISPFLDNGISESWQASPSHGTPGLDNSQFTSRKLEENSTKYEIELFQNYPNPFNPSTLINFQIPEHSQISLNVYDMLGREVAVLMNGPIQAGYHQIPFDAKNLSSGMYIYRLKAGNKVITRKLTLIK